MSFLERARQAAEQARQAAAEGIGAVNTPEAKAEMRAEASRVGRDVKGAGGSMKRGLITAVEKIDPGILADLVIKATAIQELANRSLREKGSIYRISEITITASIPPQIGFAIGRIGDVPESEAPVGRLVASSELVDSMATDDGEVVDLEGDVLETSPKADPRAICRIELHAHIATDYSPPSQPSIGGILMAWLGTIFLYLHVAGVIIAFGPSIAFPFFAAKAAQEPQHGNFVLRTTEFIQSRLVEPGAVFVALMGVGLIVTRGYNPLTEIWLLIAIVLFLITFLYAMLVQLPTVRKMIALTSGPPPIVTDAAHPSDAPAMGGPGTPAAPGAGPAARRRSSSRFGEGGARRPAPDRDDLHHPRADDLQAVLRLEPQRTWLISRRWPSGSRKKARISCSYSTGGVRNSAPRPCSVS